MPHMRFRQFIDKAFAANGVVAAPQVETDSVASLYAHVATGAWASVVPHTWLRAIPVTGAARAIRLVEPETTAQISIAIHAGVGFGRRSGVRERGRWRAARRDLRSRAATTSSRR